MLDAQTIATVKATIPLLVETGPKLTAHFYDRMFAHNPELKEIFNMSNQRNGDQREALSMPSRPTPATLKICQPCCLRWRKSRRSIPASRSNPSSTTLWAVTCWRRWTRCSARARYWTPGKAYGVLANVFINREAQIYSENASKNGGWEGTRAFRIVEKRRVAR